MSDPAGKAPTLDDVAAHAGVSAATVSRFVNNPKVVAPATAERIRAAIAVTGYIPNLLAGGLASSKSKMVAVLIPHLTDSMFSLSDAPAAFARMASGQHFGKIVLDLEAR